MDRRGTGGPREGYQGAGVREGTWRGARCGVRAWGLHGTPPNPSLPSTLGPAPPAPRGTPLSSLLTVPGLLWYGSGYRPVGRSTSNHWDTRGERGGMWGGVTPGYPHPPHTYPPPSVFPVPRTPPTPPSPSRSWCSPEAPSCTSTWKVTRAN